MNNEVETILRIASSLDEKKHPAATHLFRIAQQLGGGQDFDPSQEPAGNGYNMQVQPAPQQGQQSGMHPGIESFVQQPDVSPVDDRIQHKLTCTVLAPKGFAEENMFKYIKEISKSFPVEVFGFGWTKDQPKKPGTF